MCVFLFGKEKHIKFERKIRQLLRETNINFTFFS